MLKQKRVNVDFPAWMLESLDREAHRISPLLKSGLQKGWKLYRSIILAADSHFRRADARLAPTVYSGAAANFKGNPASCFTCSITT